MKAISTLLELYLDQLSELHSAETQMVTALPHMIKAAHDSDLIKCLEGHFIQTQNHVDRLSYILKLERTTQIRCPIMAALLGAEMWKISEQATTYLKDCALIAWAQRIKHFEISSYGTVVTFANILGQGRL